MNGFERYVKIHILIGMVREMGRVNPGRYVTVGIHDVTPEDLDVFAEAGAEKRHAVYHGEEWDVAAMDMHGPERNLIASLSMYGVTRKVEPQPVEATAEDAEDLL